MQMTLALEGSPTVAKAEVLVPRASTVRCQGLLRACLRSHPEAPGILHPRSIHLSKWGLVTADGSPQQEALLDTTEFPLCSDMIKDLRIRMVDRTDLG